MHIKLLTVLCVLVLVGCSAMSRGPSDDEVKKEQAIMSYYNRTRNQVKSVTFLEKPQVYADSFRSPNDGGTTTKVKARVEFVSGKTEDHVFAVFVAESDGWTNIKIDP